MKNKNLSLTTKKWFQVLFWAVIVIAAWEIGATVDRKSVV